MKQLQRLIIIGIALSIFGACEKFETDSPNGATDQQTITGKVVDSDENPVRNVHVKMYYHEGSIFYSYTRQKAEAWTDERGIYKLTIYKKSDETDTIPGKNAWYNIFTDMDSKKYMNDNYPCTVDELWKNRNLVLPTFTIWESQTVIVSASSVPANTKTVTLEVDYAKAANGTTCVIHAQRQFPDTFTVPKNQELKFSATWDNGLKRTRVVRKGEITGRLDLSYLE